jgi:hypothetical protein
METRSNGMKNSTYSPTSGEEEKIKAVMNISLNWAAKDIRKASHLLPDYKTYFDRTILESIYPSYDGGSMVGATILGMCVIQHVAHFFPIKENLEFKKFVDEYLGVKYSGTNLYQLRNALIKQYTTRCHSRDKKGVELIFMIMNNNPKYHLNRSGNVIIINVENFAHDICKSVENFFNDALNGKLTKEIIDKIISHHDKYLLASPK